MISSYPLTVSSILKRKHFENTRVLAGKKGLTNLVKWVHIVEVTNIGKLLNGNELILTTGISWNRNLELSLSFLKQLIDSNVSGLCIEIGTYTTTIYDELIDYANSFNFPIIVFEDEVPFVEITQDIHTYIIKSQDQIISNLEDFSHLLNKKLLNINHHFELLELLQQKTSKQIIFIKDNQMVFFPNCTHIEQMLWKEKISLLDENAENSHYRVPVLVLGYEIAQVALMSNNELEPLSELDYLLLDRTITAISQQLLNNMYVEEKKGNQRSEWIKDWLSGYHSETAITTYLNDHGLSQQNGAVVCVCRIENKQNMLSVDESYIKLCLQSIFEQQGFSLILTEKKEKAILILLNKRLISNYKMRLINAFERMKASDLSTKNGFTISIGVGKFVLNLMDVCKSYQTAEETIKIESKLLNSSLFYHFYEDLHLFRLISVMSQHLNLTEFVEEYLKPVIQHDLENNGKLLETLKVYLKCHGSKQETAKQLYIVRQTLYHRLQKLEKLLGEDFMLPEKRIAIEFMLLINDYLKPIVEISDRKEDYN
ncbi:PucR family transcriptional regulator [Litchfieldia alkalitelluris]|uniref:PucR family transcriptional regulator n=1 Tax=Litchfieldia alkalitelluris TaxID=304268 RepID=UPI001F3AC519|nr:PucR family transcriptional regulator [Litchfieldia alkalitelluris]